MKNRIFNRGVKVFTCILFTLTFITAMVMVWMGGALSPYDVSFNNEDVRHYNNGWYYVQDGQNIETAPLPTSVRSENGSITLHNRLPDIMPEGASLGVITNHQRISVSVDGVQVYEYGSKLNTLFGKTYGRVQHCIRMPKNSAEKDVAITISNPYGNEEQNIYDILLGSKTSIVFEIMRSNMLAIIFCVLILAMGILIMLWSIIVAISNLGFDIREFIYLGLFCIVASVWVATDADFLQFVSGNEVSVYLLSFFSLMILPILFLLYMKKVCRENKRIIEVMCILFVLNFAVNTFLCVSGIAYLTETITTTHVLLVVSICVCAWICIRESIIRKRKDMYEIVVAIFILFISTIISVVIFYTGNNDNNSKLFVYGVFIFAMLLGINALKKNVEILNESMEARVYRRLAYVDMMTALSNRAAFDIDAREKTCKIKPGEMYTLILCDLNNLKEINDMRGHSMGDILIKRFSDCLKHVFNGKGKCYRIGGDEFTIIMEDVKEETVLAYMRTLSAEVEIKNSEDNDGIQISYAWGKAHAVADENGTVDPKALFDEADKNMYDHKEKMRRDETNE